MACWGLNVIISHLIPRMSADKLASVLMSLVWLFTASFGLLLTMHFYVKPRVPTDHKLDGAKGAVPSARTMARFA
jgi:hypothetical protein